MITNVTEGVFILNKAIDNPKPDRRYKSQWLCATQWSPGARFAIRRARYFERYSEKVATGKIEAYELTCLDDKFSRHVIVYRDEDGVWSASALVDDLVPAILSLVENLVPSTDPEDPLFFMLLDHGGHGGGVRSGASSVLFRLFREGAVTLAQVRAALAAVDAELDAEEEGLAQKASQDP
jgi:hypothetical protein